MISTHGKIGKAFEFPLCPDPAGAAAGRLSRGIRKHPICAVLSAANGVRLSDYSRFLPLVAITFLYQ